MHQVAKTFNEILKFNPYHDRLGRFASGGGFMASGYTGDRNRQAVTFSANPNTKAGRMAIERESDYRHALIGSAYADTMPEPGNKQPKRQRKPKAEKPKEEKPKDNFTPAKSKKAAVEYAKKELGFEKVSYGTKLDLETINHINKQVADIQAKYPETKGAVSELEVSSSGRMYASITTENSGRMTFTISSKLYGNGLDALEIQYQKDVEAGFHPKGTSAKDIVWHEYGHVYAGIQCKKMYGAAANEPVPHRNRYLFMIDKSSGEWERDVLINAAQSLGKRQGQVQSAISRYAEKNVAETFAEAFAEFNGSPNPSPECLALMKAAGILK